MTIPVGQTCILVQLFSWLPVSPIDFDHVRTPVKINVRKNVTKSQWSYETPHVPWFFTKRSWSQVWFWIQKTRRIPSTAWLTSQPHASCAKLSLLRPGRYGKQRCRNTGLTPWCLAPLFCSYWKWMEMDNLWTGAMVKVRSGEAAMSMRFVDVVMSCHYIILCQIILRHKFSYYIWSWLIDHVPMKFWKDRTMRFKSLQIPSPSPTQIWATAVDLRWGCIITVVRLTIACVLLCYGTLYVVHTINLSDLVLNCIALEIVLNVSWMCWVDIQWWVGCPVSGVTAVVVSSKFEEML